LNDDLKLISGNFFDLVIPKEKQYLLKYFDTDIQEQFLRYYMEFGHYKRFVDHTGVVCTRRWLQKMKTRYENLVEIHDKAKKDLDFDTLEAIQMGKYKV
jgi:hypothetical protein